MSNHQHPEPEADWTDSPTPNDEGVRVQRPSASQQDNGVVRHFSWRSADMEVSGDVSRSGAGLVMSRLEIRGPMPMGLTHKLLHRVPIGEILAEVRADVSRQTAPLPAAVSGYAMQLPIPPGRVLVTDALLREVALAYLDETAPGKDRAVLQRLEALFGRPKGTLRTWLARARAEGWLGPAVQGRMGAEPGPKLLEEFARTPRATQTGPKQVLIVMPPADEAPDVAQERTLKEWQDVRRPPNRVDIDMEVPPPAGEPTSE